MELKDLKDSISIIYFIKSMTDEALKLSNNSEVQFLYLTNEIDSEEYFNKTTGKRIELESNLKLLNIALISLKIEDEEKYFKLKKEILELNSECQYLYTLPETPPNILSNHIRDLQVFQFVSKSTNITSSNFKNDVSLGTKEDLELNKKDRIKLLYQLGILKFLVDTYPRCKNNESEVARLICKISPDLKKETIQSYINDIMTSGLDKTKDNDLEIISIVNTLKN